MSDPFRFLLDLIKSSIHLFEFLVRQTPNPAWHFPVPFVNFPLLLERHIFLHGRLQRFFQHFEFGLIRIAIRHGLFQFRLHSMQFIPMHFTRFIHFVVKRLNILFGRL